MSFLDLATLATHRRSEMEARINILANKCDQAQGNVKRLKLQAQGFVERLNCEPSQLKDRFLDCMKQLDEYIYLITDFNLAVGKLEETATQEQLPVQDVAPKQLKPIVVHPPHLLDVLSEPTPSTSTACANQCPATRNKPKHKRPPKEDFLIEFSSASCSQESFPERSYKVEVLNDIPTEGVNNSSLQESVPSPIEKWNLPAQTVLQTEVNYHGCIMHVHGTSIWIITDKYLEVLDLTTKMCDHYRGSEVRLSKEQLLSLTYCAYYDEETESCYRCLYLGLVKDSEMAELFLVDTGEVRLVPVDIIQPLAQQFCDKPPFARCCHLAGVDMLDHDDKELLEKQEEFLSRFCGAECNIQVDDNTSESLGVYISLPHNELLNKLVVNEGLAVPNPFCEPQVSSPAAVSGGEKGVRGEVRKPLVEVSDEELDLDDGPEYEDPLEAVTGYHNRDEAEICKHYKGGPDKSCFKGARCKKRHIRMHPGGWTLDKVEVSGKGKTLPLPAPGTWHKVRVTYVGHFDHVFVQFVTDELEEQKRTFGVVLPPKTLSSLVRDMNSPAARVAHRPLKLAPAPGELVAALYPPDDQWYRASVISLTKNDQSVEVQYVDYGNELWVKENNIRELDPAYTVLPFQAVRCKLAGVVAKTSQPEQWGRAKQALRDLVQDRVLNALIIACHYDELEIELYDSDEYSVAEKLAARGEVDLQDVVLQEGDAPAQVIVVP